MSIDLETYAIGTFYRIQKAIENEEYEYAKRLCTDGITYVKSLSVNVETNSNNVEIF